MTEREMARKKAAARKARARKARSRRVLTTVALMLVVCVASIGGTIAWLQAKSDTVVNTFTHSDINIKLEETDATDENQDGNWEKSFKMVPGGTITKDPKVTVLEGSENCYLFVKLVKSENYDTYLEEYVIADGWAELTSGVYYRQVNATDDGKEFAVLKNDQIKVLTSVTKEQMEAIKTSGQPTLTVQAFAVQSDNIASVHEAWKQVDTEYSVPTTPSDEEGSSAEPDPEG